MILYRELNSYLGRLFETARTPDLSTIHKVKAYNTLCGFMEVCLRSNDQSLKSVIDDLACSSLLTFYIDFHDGARAKSMKQIMNTILSMMQDGTTDDVSSHKRTLVLRRLVQVVFREASFKKTRPAIVLLTTCFARNIVSLGLFVETYCSVSQNKQRENVYAILSEMVQQLLSFLSFSSMASATGGLLAIIFDAMESQEAKSITTAGWAQLLLDYAERQHADLSALQTYVLPNILGAESRRLTHLLQALGIMFGDSGTRIVSLSSQKAISGGPGYDLLLATLCVGSNRGAIVITGGRIHPQKCLRH